MSSKLDTSSSWFAISAFLLDVRKHWPVLSLLLHQCFNLFVYRLDHSWIIICCDLHKTYLLQVPYSVASIPPVFVGKSMWILSFLLRRFRRWEHLFCLAATRVWRRDSMLEARFSRFEEPAFSWISTPGNGIIHPRMRYKGQYAVSYPWCPTTRLSFMILGLMDRNHEHPIVEFKSKQKFS